MNVVFEAGPPEVMEISPESWEILKKVYDDNNVWRAELFTPDGLRMLFPSLAKPISDDGSSD